VSHGPSVPGAVMAVQGAASPNEKGPPWRTARKSGRKASPSADMVEKRLTVPSSHTNHTISCSVDICRPRQRLTALTRPQRCGPRFSYQRAGSHVSDRVGTLPEIGTVPRSGGMAKFPEGGTGVGFPTRSEPVALAGSIGVGGSDTALRLEILGERWLSTGAMVPRSSGMETTTRCAGRIWAKCGRGTGNGTPGPGATSCSLAVSGTSAQADKPRTSRLHVDKTEAPRARMLDFQQRSTHG